MTDLREWQLSDFNPPPTHEELDRFWAYQHPKSPSTISTCRCGRASRDGRICVHCIQKVRAELLRKEGNDD